MPALGCIDTLNSSVAPEWDGCGSGTIGYPIANAILRCGFVRQAEVPDIVFFSATFCGHSFDRWSGGEIVIPFKPVRLWHTNAHLALQIASTRIVDWIVDCTWAYHQATSYGSCLG